MMRSLSLRPALRPDCLALLLVAVVVTFQVSAPVAALAAEEEVEKLPYIPRATKPLEPAKRYQGRTPVDLTNGLLFDNGTFGLRNEGYEKWSENSSIIPGISTQDYPFRDKEELVAQLNEFAQFIEDAITNWKATPRDSVKPWGQEASGKMQPMLDQFREAIKHADSSSQSDWDKNQADARKALASINAAYSDLHHNVH